MHFGVPSTIGTPRVPFYGTVGTQGFKFLKQEFLNKKLFNARKIRAKFVDLKQAKGCNIFTVQILLPESKRTNSEHP